LVNWEWHELITLFRYNWMVRDEWFELCKQIPFDELLRKRIGGERGILYTLFHIVDVEYSWICGMQGKPDIQVQYDNYKSIQQLRELSGFLESRSATVPSNMDKRF
jgi:uncharacterized damage-inducible protein DinB